MDTGDMVLSVVGSFKELEYFFGGRGSFHHSLFDVLVDSFGYLILVGGYLLLLLCFFLLFRCRFYIERCIQFLLNLFP